LWPVLYEFGGNAQHSGVEDILRHQMNKHVVSCASPCPPPPGQGGAFLRIARRCAVATSPSGCLRKFVGLPTTSPCLSLQKYTALGPCYPATQRFARPHTAQDTLKEVPDVPHLFGAEDRTASFSPTTSTHGYFIVVSFDELIYYSEANHA
jgi:hypothetical protein